MMGSKDDGQAQFFYAFELEALIPQDHLLRGIDRFLDLDELRTHLAPFYSHTGRPSDLPALTGPTAAAFDGTWKLDDIVEIKTR